LHAATFYRRDYQHESPGSLPGSGRIWRSASMRLSEGGVSRPLRETPHMLDRSDPVSDWPLLNALLTSCSAADLGAIRGGGSRFAGYFQSLGVALVASGSTAAHERLPARRTANTGIGIMRYADPGYPDADVSTNRLKWLRITQPPDSPQGSPNDHTH
jgi:urocanate hydratase